MLKKIPVLCLILTLYSDHSLEGHMIKKLTVTSAAFQAGDHIPDIYTCDGKNFSPPISWSEVPLNSKSIVLIVDDPDAPKGAWVHWIAFNLPPHLTELPQNASIKDLGGLEGTTSFESTGYGGPCPPSGSHRYYFKIYALDTILDLEPSIGKQELVQAMQGHILAEGQLMGIYRKP